VAAVLRIPTALVAQAVLVAVERVELAVVQQAALALSMAYLVVGILVAAEAAMAFLVQAALAALVLSLFATPALFSILLVAHRATPTATLSTRLTPMELLPQQRQLLLHCQPTI
jgi:hypothetical protein